MTIGVVFLLVVWRLDALAVEDGLVAVDQRRLGSQVGRRLVQRSAVAAGEAR